MRQITEVKVGSTQGLGRRTRAVRRVRRGAAAALAGAAGLAGLGCNADSWFDPSVVGYWEETPTTMPILDRIAAIEDKTPDLVETSPPVREDLIAGAQPYRLGPGDDIEIRIPNFEQIGFESQYPRQIDQRGYVTLPRVGQVYLLGKTDIEAQDAIALTIRTAEIMQTPSVSVIVQSPRQLTFTILGGVRAPGVFIVNKPDYRLLDAIGAAQGIDESAEKLFVVRQIALSGEATGQAPPPPTSPSTQPVTAPPVNPESLFEEIQKLTDPKAPAGTNPPTPTTPSTTPPPAPTGGGLGVMSSGPKVLDGERRASTYTGLQPEKAPAPSEPKPAPPVDLIDSNEPTKATAPSPSPAPAPNAPPERTPEAHAPRPTSGARAKARWVFLNGQWTKDVAPAAPAVPGMPTDPLAGEPAGKNLMTQRVIEVPIRALLAGQSDVNIVIRPGDVVRVPTPSTGVVYVGGQVARPGTFSLPVTGKLTLIRVIDAAGGLSQLGIPERVELTRMVGSNREATILLNMRAISERTQPDVILKADDRINVGTNFWAFPLAIIRNGFRMSYGFGFLIDRNFGNDIFGAPPENLRGQ